MERKHQLVLLIIAALILFGAGYKYAQVTVPVGDNELVADFGTAPGGDINEVDSQEPEPQQVVVHVAGAVQRPGVYRLTAGSRVVDAINMAGSTEDSALDYLNLAAPLQDGKQITVYSIKDLTSYQLPPGPGDPAPGLGTSTPAVGVAGMATGGRVNINTAGQAELEELPGIGPALAQRIIDHRNKNGPFLSPEDIMVVSGIGEKRYEQLKDLITI